MIELSRFQHLDSSLYKAFMAAASELNFTAAAGKAAMTQSGVSQQIARLEEQVGAKLFERVNKRILLTDAGRLLAELIEQQQDQLEKYLETVTAESREVRGQVRYAMPHSCLFTTHFQSLLRDRMKNFAGITLKVHLCPNDEVLSMLVNREIDFGFLTKKSKNPGVRHQVFAREQYVLIGSRPLKPDAKTIATAPFVDYPGMPVLFDVWRRHHLPSARKLSSEGLNTCGTINSLHGALTMVSEGLGSTVVPKHCALDRPKIWIYENPSRPDPENEIYIGTLSEVKPPQRVQRVLEAFWEMKRRES